MQQEAHQDDDAKRGGTRRSRCPLHRQEQWAHPAEHAGPTAVPFCNDLEHRHEKRGNRQSDTPKPEPISFAQHQHGVKRSAQRL